MHGLLPAAVAEVRVHQSWLPISCPTFSMTFFYVSCVCFVYRRLSPLRDSSILQVLQRALARSSSPSSQSQGTDVGTNDDVDPTVGTSPGSGEATPPPPPLHDQHQPPRPPRGLDLDGALLRQAIRAATVIDNEYFPLNTIVVCLAVGVLSCCVLVSVSCWRALGNRYGATRKRGGRGGVGVHGMPQPVSSVKQRKKWREKNNTKYE